MTGRIFEINYQRSLIAFEVNSEQGIDYDYLEILDFSDDFDIDDIIIGDSNNSCDEKIIISNLWTGKKTTVYIDDFGCTLSYVRESIM